MGIFSVFQNKYKKFCLLSFIFFFISSFFPAYSAVIDRSPYGMVSTQDPYSAKVGAAILEAGGNAVDAAVAIGFSAAVTYPRAGNIGGGGFMMIHHAARNETKVIDYRETAPAFAFREMFLNSDGHVNEHRKKFSLKSSGTPGTVKGLELAWSLYGSKEWSELIAPAISLAEEGFPVYGDLESSLLKYKKRLIKDKEIRRIFFDKYKLPKTRGDVIIQTDLAEILKLIRDQGSDGFYKGKTAEKIVAFMKKRLGMISFEDLSSYKPILRDPLFLDMEEYRVATMPPPSSGGIVLIQMLQMLDRLKFESTSYASPQYYHVLAEVSKRSFADRAEFMGDADFVHVPVEPLTSSLYARRMADGVSVNSVTPSSLIAPGQHAPKPESLETTHFTVMDRWGNVVTNTYTLNYPYGNGQMVAGAGFILNNEMDDFTAKPQSANGYGLVGNERNLPEAGKRPLSSMTPTILFKDNKPLLATGAPGGPMIISAVTQLLSARIFHGKSIQEATELPRIHHQWLPDTLYVEKMLPQHIRSVLEGMGHDIKERDSVGRIQSVEFDGAIFTGMADPRSSSATSLGVSK